MTKVHIILEWFLVYFGVYPTDKLWIHFQVESLICCWIFYHKYDWFAYLQNTIELKINHLFDHQKTVDPVHLFLSLSSESEFPQKPLPIALSSVACININL